MDVVINEFRDLSQKPITEAWLKRCREIAAQCWCQAATEKVVMDVNLAEVFAQVLAQQTSRPWLGNATTEELRVELEARGQTEPGYYTAMER